jgi:hypothetical protein
LVAVVVISAAVAVISEAVVILEEETGRLSHQQRKLKLLEKTLTNLCTYYIPIILIPISLLWYIWCLYVDLLITLNYNLRPFKWRITSTWNSPSNFVSITFVSSI